MAAPLTPAQRDRLQAAADYVLDQTAAGSTAAAVIAGLVRHHRATYHNGGTLESRLRVAGVAATCTFSPENGLLNNWRKTATVRLAMAAQS